MAAGGPAGDRPEFANPSRTRLVSAPHTAYLPPPRGARPGKSHISWDCTPSPTDQAPAQSTAHKDEIKASNHPNLNPNGVFEELTWQANLLGCVQTAGGDIRHELRIRWWLKHPNPDTNSPARNRMPDGRLTSSYPGTNIVLRSADDDRNIIRDPDGA